MKLLEIEGKTIDEAIEKACKEFNVPREKLNLEIISEGSSGFLGLIGSKKAHIKASIMSIDVGLDTSFEKSGSKSVLQHAPTVGNESDETVAIRAKRAIEEILARMNLDFPVTVEETSETVTLNIKGAGNGLLIGKKGQTLDAIQYIVNRISNKHGKDRKRIIIDTEEYRKRKEKSLIVLAEKLGKKVKKTNKPVTISNLNAHDRRIVHLTLQDDKSLTTKSRGDGAYRKIIVLPNKSD
ncbi:MAG: RNA-binding cell elongation regulator Jag/EloR [Thermodesulfobacteriota bacterium]|nr:RNA-binding cell elongation regulator Jag/EloR [Thermodesulfobacteriota bacterium]